MRTYSDIYKEYLDWAYNKTLNEKYLWDNYFAQFEDENVAKAALYKSVLKLCYDKKAGMYYFIKFIVGDLTDLGYPNPLRFNGLLRRWERLVRRYKKLAVMSARGHGKSVFFSELLTLYDMFLFPYMRTILISSSSEQAEHLMRELKMIVDNNEWLLTKKGDKWAESYIDYNKGYVMAKGVGSEILGQHVDRIILDDILRTDNKLTDQEIEDYIDMNLDPMLLNRNGQMIIVGTPKRDTDIFATIFTRVKLEPKTPWKIAKFPAILDYDKKILQCPDRFTWESIMEKRLSMGPLKFAREYQLEFFSRDTSLFPSHILQPAKDKGREAKLLFIKDRRPSNWMLVGGVDVARSGSVSADYTVVFIIAYNTVTNQKQIVHMWREKGMKIREQAAKIAEISRAFDHPMFLVEQNNFGQDLIDELVDVYNVQVESFITGSKGQKKDDLIRFLVQAFEYEQMVIPRGDEYSREMTDILEDELSKFCVITNPNTGNERFEGVGSHDDCVMALALANKATQIGGVPFAITMDGKGGGNTFRDPDSVFLGFGGNNSRDESDLVAKILMGLIK